MGQGEAEVSSSFAELERALSSVPGIVAASVTVAEGTGRGRLRLRLAPGEDPDAIAWAVSATLRERFGIALDPDAIRPRLETDEARSATTDSAATGHAVTVGPATDATDRGSHDVSARPAGPADAATVTRVASELAGTASRRVRAAIRDLVTRQGERDVEVVATLEIAGRLGRSTARSVPTRRGVWRAVAEATVGALEQLTDDHLQADVDRVVVHSGDDAPMVTVVVTVLSDRGEETLLGASLLRDDPEAAVMRATLDALNRRVERWLPTATAG
jgi:hypothetical protein